MAKIPKTIIKIFAPNSKGGPYHVGVCLPFIKGIYSSGRYFWVAHYDRPGRADERAIEIKKQFTHAEIKFKRGEK